VRLGATRLPEIPDSWTSDSSFGRSRLVHARNAALRRFAPHGMRIGDTHPCENLMPLIAGIGVPHSRHRHVVERVRRRPRTGDASSMFHVKHRVGSSVRRNDALRQLVPSSEFGS